MSEKSNIFSGTIFGTWGIGKLHLLSREIKTEHLVEKSREGNVDVRFSVHFSMHSGANIDRFPLSGMPQLRLCQGREMNTSTGNTVLVNFFIGSSGVSHRA